MIERRERQEVKGLQGVISFRVPADEFVAFKRVAAAYFESDSEAAREGCRMLVEKYAPEPTAKAS